MNRAVIESEISVDCETSSADSRKSIVELFSDGHAALIGAFRAVLQKTVYNRLTYVSWWNEFPCLICSIQSA